MKFDEINILELLPQKPPFVMVDALTHCDDVITKTVLKIKAENIFVENNEFTASGMMENIAQTCAARMGYINKHLSAGEVKIGFLGSIKDFVVEELAKVGDELKTTVEVVNSFFAITMVTAKVEVSGRLIASCEMKISLSEINGK